MKRVAFCFLVALAAIQAHAQTLCPDGSYVDRPPCKLCPDGSYIGGGGRCQMTPRGDYVRGNEKSRPRLAPDGSYTEGGKKQTLCPDGSYASGRRCVLAPNGRYVGRD